MNDVRKRIENSFESFTRLIYKHSYLTLLVTALVYQQTRLRSRQVRLESKDLMNNNLYHKYCYSKKCGTKFFITHPLGIKKLTAHWVSR